MSKQGLYLQNCKCYDGKQKRTQSQLYAERRGNSLNQSLMDFLKRITPEEQAILDGQSAVDMKIYNTEGTSVIDSGKLLPAGRLIDIRVNTRFVHFPRHTHNYVEMVYMVQGSTTHIINDSEKVVLQAGDILLLNQYVTQELLPAGSDDIAVNFIILPDFFTGTLSLMQEESSLKDFITMSLSGMDMPGYLHYASQGLLPVQNLIENMIWTLAGHKHGVDTINMATMGLLFLNLMRFVPTAQTLSPAVAEQNLVYEMIRYIDMHYRDAQLSAFAMQHQESTYYLSRLLKKNTGKNFKELLKMRKMREAGRMLHTTTLSTDGIMERIGYSNSSFFYRTFRQQYGMSPADYRDSIRKQE